MRAAVIDVGSNAVRIELAEWSGERLLPLHRDRIVTRLGALTEDRMLDAGAMRRTVDAITTFREGAGRFGAMPLRIVGTAAVRQAANAQKLGEAIRNAVGLELEILSPEAEALAIFRSASHGMATDSPSAVLDIGGGSTELVIGEGGEITHLASIPLGAVNLAARYEQSDVIDPALHASMCSEIDRMLVRLVPDPLPDLTTVVGVGGSLTSVARALGAPEASVEGFVLPRSDIETLQGRLIGTDARGRTALRGIDLSRAGIIVGGVTLIGRVMNSLALDALTTHEGGVARGILLDVFARD